MKHAERGMFAALAALLTACPAARAQADTTPVIRVAMSPERLAGYAEHTRNHLGFFDTSNAGPIPLDAFISPGAKRDPLPALVSPEWRPAKDATFPPRNDQVVEVVIDGEAVAYPLSVLTYHGVVNDTIGETPVAVWHDPISNGLAVFRRDVSPTRNLGAGEEEPRVFRLAGLLVHGSAALYDGQSRSLFSPLDGMGATGRYAGARLEFLPFRVTTFADFAASRPDGMVVRKPEGSTFDYAVNPFAGYQSDANFVYMKVTEDVRLAPKVIGVGVAAGEDSYFIPFGALLDGERSVMTVEGSFAVELTPDRTLRVKEAPAGAAFAQAYFANWVAAHPTSSLILRVELRDLPEGAATPR